MPNPVPAELSGQTRDLTLLTSGGALLQGWFGQTRGLSLSAGSGVLILAPDVQAFPAPAAPMRRVHLAVIQAPGLAAVTLPLSSLQYRTQEDGYTVIVAVVPDADHWESQVAARLDAGGLLRIFSGYRDQSGQDDVVEVARGGLESYTSDVGAQRSSLVLTATQPMEPTIPRTVTLTGVTYQALQADGRRRVRCAPQLYLRPGDTALYAGHALVVNRCAVTIGRDTQRMEVTGW